MILLAIVIIPVNSSKPRASGDDPADPLYSEWLVL